MGASLVVISIDDQADAINIRDTEGLTYPVLYDTDRAVTRNWGVFDLLGDGVAAPAAFIVDRNGNVAWSQIGENIADRPTSDELLLALVDVQASA